MPPKPQQQQLTVASSTAVLPSSSSTSYDTKKVGLYEIGRLIGTGPASRVRLALDTNTRDPYAIKIIAKPNGLLPPHKIDETAKKEIACAKLLRHKYIINLREVMETERFIYFVNELVTGGELFDKLVVSNFLMMKRAAAEYAPTAAEIQQQQQLALQQQQQQQDATTTNTASSKNKVPSSEQQQNSNNDSSSLLLQNPKIAFANLQKEIIMPQEAIDNFIRSQEDTSSFSSSNRNSNSTLKPASLPRFKEETARKYFQQLIVAIRFCHLNNIYHKNLKPQNLLLDRQGNLKIADMSLTALKLKYENNQQALPPLSNYLSVLNAKKDNKKAVVDSFGMVINGNNNNNNHNNNGSVPDEGTMNNTDDDDAINFLSSTTNQNTSLMNQVAEEKARRRYNSEKQLRHVLSLIGNVHYAAPEILLQKGYSSTISDIWSCGVLLYLMLAGHHPFDDSNPKELLKKIERGQYFMSPVIPDGAKDLIKKILVVEPARRISMNEIVAHSWFQTNFEAAKELDLGSILSANLLLQQKNSTSLNSAAARRDSTSSSVLASDGTILAGGAGVSSAKKKIDEAEKIRLLTQLMMTTAAGGDATQGSNQVQDQASKNLEFIKSGEDAFVIARKLMLASLVSSPRVEAVAARAAQEALKEQKQQQGSAKNILPGAAAGGFSPTAALRYVLLRIHFDEVSKVISETLTSMMPHFQPPNAGSLEFRGFAQAKHGLLTFQIILSRTVVPTLTLCEIKKGRGDFFDFIEFVSAVINTIGSARVASQEMVIRAPKV